jgi:hypothetical protein
MASRPFIEADVSIVPIADYGYEQNKRAIRRRRFIVRIADLSALRGIHYIPLNV